MANIIDSTLLCLDSVMGEPHVWARAYFDDPALRHSLEQLERYTRDCVHRSGRPAGPAAGYHADLAVLTGDYFSVPDDDSIKDLKSVIQVMGPTLPGPPSAPALL